MEVSSRVYSDEGGFAFPMPELEELVSGFEAADSIARAGEIAREEWEKIRLSLSLCGDAGEFRGDDFMLGVISEETIAREPLLSPTKSVSLYSPTYYPMYLVANLLEFAEKFPDKKYRSTEALYVYVELVAKAAGRLGLDGNLAMGFASGYAHARTGWIAEKGLEGHRDVFCDMFFSRRRKSYDWEFHWTSVQRTLRDIWRKFLLWKASPSVRGREAARKATVKPFIV